MGGGRSTFLGTLQFLDSSGPPYLFCVAVSQLTWELALRVVASCGVSTPVHSGPSLGLGVDVLCGAEALTPTPKLLVSPPP